MSARKFDAALIDEVVRIRALTSVESRARAVRRALALVRHAEKEINRERAEVIGLLCREYGWSHKAAATYFGISRQRADQIIARPGHGLEACDTLPISEDVAAAPSEGAEPLKGSATEGYREGAGFPKGNPATEPQEDS